jgi:hypothetical protein
MLRDALRSRMPYGGSPGLGLARLGPDVLVVVELAAEERAVQARR